MKGSKGHSLPVADIVRQFRDIAIQQDKALLGNDVKTYNKLYLIMDQLTSDLKSRAGDQRRALESLYDDPNPQVRMKAAVRTLAINYQKARDILEQIAVSGPFPTAGHAGMTLNALDRGIFKPS